MARLTDVIDDDRGGVFATSLSKGDSRRGLTHPDLVFLDLDGSKIHTAKQFLVA
jgi:hypothetical protein